MQLALYRKYRSKNLDELVGQEHITKSLSEAIKNGKIRHAYLFTGPHGIGKTSVARILAHEITGLKYDGTNHIDIIEIDAASNRRIDEVRDLREKARIAPVEAKYKVYIIDEVHMLTSEAFNALLKTLEEPPEHVVFILATTEAHKLPETIISRTQRFQFRPISSEDIVKHLKDIALSEKINISDEALQVLAQHGNGSFRDSISLLDQISTLDDKKIDVKEIQSLLGLTDQEQIEQLLQSIFAGDAKALSVQLKNILGAGINPSTLASQIASKLQAMIAENPSLNYIKLLEEIIEVSSSSHPKQKLEVVLLKSALLFGSASNSSPAMPVTPPPRPEPKPEVKPQVKAPEPPADKTEIKQEISQQPEPTPKPTTSITPLSGADEDIWQKVVNHIKQEKNSLYSVIRLAKPKVESSTMKLTFKFGFHQKRAEQADNKRLIETCLEQFFGRNLVLETAVDSSLPDMVVNTDIIDKPVEEISPASSSVLDIMGGGEVIAYNEEV